MRLKHFDDFVAVPISTELYMAIAKRCPGGVSSLIEDVVYDFLDRADEDGVYEATKLTNGIYWSSVFLPSGTQLRVNYRNEYKYAEVVEDKIEYEGRKLPSASQMASMMRNNTSVNAWKHVEVKRPHDKSWVWADILRRA